MQRPSASLLTEINLSLRRQGGTPPRSLLPLGVLLTALISEAANSFAFGPFLLIPGRQQLLKGHESLRVGGRALDLLTALVARPGQVLFKQELISHVWQGLVVEESNLKVNISALRRLLGDGSDPPLYIETMVGTGYRFIADVRHVSYRPQAQARTVPTPARIGNLKLPAGGIHGRDGTITSVLGDLRGCRLVSIVGPGGVGKTSVARAVAERGGSAFKSGAWFVDLTRLDDPELVPTAIADALRESAASMPQMRAKHGQPIDHEVLLILDNCEHLIGAVALCADHLLASTRHVKLLATSREPLCIRSEIVRRLSGLGLPPQRAQLSAEEALSSPAVQLFVDRAGEQQSSFRLDDANAADVAAICRRLDGHALAIERVARRVGSLGVAGTLDHLARRFHMLDGHHEGPERHRTLTATVASSYERLSGSEQRVLRCLSVFEGRFSLAAACFVGAARDMNLASVIEDIGQLVAKSLVVAEAQDGEMHYRQTQLTRAFTMEQLIAHGELDDAQQRFAACLANGTTT